MDMSMDISMDIHIHGNPGNTPILPNRVNKVAMKVRADY
jgi:hypothetical protein